MREGRVARVGESGACDVSGARVDSILSGGSVATHVRVRVRARVTVVWAVAGRGGGGGSAGQYASRGDEMAGALVWTVALRRIVDRSLALALHVDRIGFNSSFFHGGFRCG